MNVKPVSKKFSAKAKKDKSSKKRVKRFEGL
jgi:hypothetical protein